MASHASRAQSSRTRMTASSSRKGGPLVNWMVGLIGLGVVLGGMAAYGLAQTAAPSASQAPAIHGIRCDQGAGDRTRYEVHLSASYLGKKALLPGGIGIQKNCAYWLRTVDQSGVITIDAPSSVANTRPFTLGDFFAVWHQPLTPVQVAQTKLRGAEAVQVYLNGVPYIGDPNQIELHFHDQVAIEIGPPFPKPEQSFDFRAPRQNVNPAPPSARPTTAPPAAVPSPGS